MKSPNINEIKTSRRKFIFKGAALAVASQVGVYAVGSMFKELGGSLVAGAKCQGACSGAPRYECGDGSGCYSAGQITSGSCSAHSGQGIMYVCSGTWQPL